jgi:hypothetical protein
MRPRPPPGRPVADKVAGNSSRRRGRDLIRPTGHTKSVKSQPTVSRNRRRFPVTMSKEQGQVAPTQFNAELSRFEELKQGISTGKKRIP